MKTKAELVRERERLEHALRDLRNDMVSWAGRTPLKMMLDEAHLMGQIKAIEYAISASPGGWPHDAWFLFEEARTAAVLSMLKAGKSHQEILSTLNDLTEVKTRLIAKVDEPDPNPKN